jgi:hypothetical protein
MSFFLIMDRAHDLKTAASVGPPWTNRCRQHGVHRSRGVPALQGTASHRGATGRKRRHWGSHVSTHLTPATVTNRRWQVKFMGDEFGAGKKQSGERRRRCEVMGCSRRLFIRPVELHCFGYEWGEETEGEEKWVGTGTR